MSYFERSSRTASNRLLQRIERLTWILIYGGLLALLLGWWVLPTDDFPDFAKSMIGAKIAVTETVIWSRASVDGSRTGTITLGIGDAPISMNGTMKLAPSAVGTRIDIDGDLKATIPLIGGKIEKAAAPSIIKAMDKEQQTGTAWLKA